jgi:hypothetical protein
MWHVYYNILFYCNNILMRLYCNKPYWLFGCKYEVTTRLFADGACAPKKY